MNQKTFTAKVKSVLSDNKNDRAVTRLRAGALDTKSYKNINTTGKVFKKKQERKGKNYKVSLLLDASGSMRTGADGRADTLRKMIPPLVQTLTDAGADVEINAFNALFYPMSEFGQTIPKDFNKTFADRYNKALRDTRIKQVKRGDKRTYQIASKKDIAENKYHYDQASGWNFDAWAIHQAIAKLNAEDGNKILIVFSDGQPTNENWYHTSDLNKSINDYSIPYQIKLAKHSGITVLSVGIQTECVYNYYPKRDTVIVHKLEHMYEGITKLLSLNIKRG